jgi:hypothetical protein
MPNNETVEHKTAILVALAQDVPGFYHDRGDDVYHLSSDVAGVHKKFVSTFGFFVEGFLPKTNPEFQGETRVELGFKFGVEREAVVFTTSCEHFFDSLLIQDTFISLTVLYLVHIKEFLQILYAIFSQLKAPGRPQYLLTDRLVVPYLSFDS